MDSKTVLSGEDGRCLHLGLMKGDPHSRIICVGEENRAKRIAEKFLSGVNQVAHTSRAFRCYNGEYKGKPISVISIGMGYPNADFFIKEVSYCLNNNPMAVVRIGTCSTFNENINPGSICLAQESFFCAKNYAHFDGITWLDSNDCNADSKSCETDCKCNKSSGSCPCCDRWKEYMKSPYIITGPVKPDEKLTMKIHGFLRENNREVDLCKHVSCDTFYASQGRYSDAWDDENEKLLSVFKTLNIKSCEMETNEIFHQSKHMKMGPIYVAAVAVAVINRGLTPERHCEVKKASEAVDFAAEAVLEALISTDV